MGTVKTVPVLLCIYYLWVALAQNRTQFCFAKGVFGGHRFRQCKRRTFRCSVGYSPLARFFRRAPCEQAPRRLWLKTEPNFASQKVYSGAPLPPMQKAHRLVCLLRWRKRWDSNPRYREVQLISSQSRYDHFDTLPYCEREYYTIVFKKLQVLFEKR